jgi:prophage maintenance system killer protein
VKELTIDDIVEIHAIGIEMWGGDGSLRPDTRDRVDGALGAAIAAAMYASTGENDVLAYAAGVLTYLGRAQYFVDGNKRAAWGGCVRALETNGYTVVASTEDIISLVGSMVVERLSVEEIADRLGLWIEIL